jgi:hypothetical protein
MVRDVVQYGEERRFLKIERENAARRRALIIHATPSGPERGGVGGRGFFEEAAPGRCREEFARPMQKAESEGGQRFVVEVQMGDVIARDVSQAVFPSTGKVPKAKSGLALQAEDVGTRDRDRVSATTASVTRSADGVGVTHESFRTKVKFYRQTPFYRPNRYKLSRRLVPQPASLPGVSTVTLRYAIN